MGSGCWPRYRADVPETELKSLWTPGLLADLGLFNIVRWSQKWGGGERQGCPHRGGTRKRDQARDSSGKGERAWEGNAEVSSPGVRSQGSQSTGTKPIIRGDKYSVTEVRAWLT